MTYAVATNEKCTTGVMLFIFKYSPELHKGFLEGLPRLSNLDVDESAMSGGEDSLCCTT